MHYRYAFYLPTIDARPVVNWGTVAVTWSDPLTNHRRAAYYITQITFRIPQAAIPQITHSQTECQNPVLDWRLTSVLDLI